MTQEKTFIDIVILNFNQEAHTLECLLSLKRMNYKDYRIILVDNGSTDGSGPRLKEKFPQIEFLRSQENVGFAGGCNLGIKASEPSGKADYVLLLNNDTIVGEELINKLLEAAARDAGIGILGAVNYYYDRPEKVHMAAHRFRWWLGIQGIIYEVRDEYRQVQSVSACCMLIKKTVLEKVGLLDERFFAYYEDSDLCMRACRAGFKVVAVRGAKVWHRISAVLGTKGPQEYYIYTRNQPLFMAKNCPRIFLLNYFIVYFLKVSVRTAYFFITSKSDIARAVAAGVSDFLRGRFGKGRLFG